MAGNSTQLSIPGTARLPSIRRNKAAFKPAGPLEQEVHYRDLVLGNLSQGVCLYGPDARIRLANRRWGEILGIDESLTRPGTPLREVLAGILAGGHHPEHSIDSLVGSSLELVALGRPQRVVLTRANGRLIAVDHVPLPDGSWLRILEDITERRRVEDRAAFLAQHDALTGLPNRSLLGDRLDQAISATGRGARFALLCLNLDHFKSVNDTLGHGTGDRVLRAVGERLSACARETDFVARLGADEFAIIQAGITSPEDCARFAQRICAVLTRPIQIDWHLITVSASIGIAICPDDGLRGEVLLSHADAAMDLAKQDEGCSFRLFEPEMDVRVQARRTLEIDLRAALAGNALELHYQPLVNVASGGVNGFEALLRWRRPDGTMVPPSQFIPVAEEIGVIGDLGDWVLRTACREAATWPDPLRVAVNVSPVQFKCDRVADSVRSALASANLPANRLELEITEMALLADNPATLGVLRNLRGAGVRIAMDDFGTGFSSLSYLRSFPFDKIKIDQSFVRDLEAPADSTVIVGAMVGLGHSLGMPVTAEGVETERQLARLRAAGCDEAQGYLFGRPTPGGDVSTVISRLNASRQ